jgi:hypothetical protein
MNLRILFLALYLFTFTSGERIVHLPELGDLKSQVK